MKIFLEKKADSLESVQHKSTCFAKRNALMQRTKLPVLYFFRCEVFHFLSFLLHHFSSKLLFFSFTSCFSTFYSIFVTFQLLTSFNISFRSNYNPCSTQQLPNYTWKGLLYFLYPGQKILSVYVHFRDQMQKAHLNKTLSLKENNL